MPIGWILQGRDFCVRCSPACDDAPDLTTSPAYKVSGSWRESRPNVQYKETLQRFTPVCGGIIEPAAYAAAISRVALIGSFSTLHSADRFASRGRQ